MELKDFIKTAISDITNAVGELQNELENGAIISPSLPTPIVNHTIKDPNDIKCIREITKINFDIAITVGNTDKTEAGGSAGIHIFSAKIENGNEEHTENASRITFTIPIVLPTHKV